METFVRLCKDDSLDSVSREKEIQGLLNTNSINPKVSDGDGWYPVHYAALYGRLEIARILLPHCDPHIEVSAGRNHHSTALHLACTNGRFDIVEILLPHCQRGAPMKRDRDGNTPLHLACRFGSLKIVHRLLSKYDNKSMTNVNNRQITPLGLALSGNHNDIAKYFMKLSVDNPARKFPDFRQHFPSLSKEQSLDHPVSIFVMGNKNTGKSTLIKSLQVEGYWNRAKGAFLPTARVEHHSGGIVSSDVSSYGYGRAKFYELASCRETTQEGIFLSLEDPAHSIFVITLSFKDELKDIEASLLFWLCFIHHQLRTIKPKVKPSVAVVASFVFYTRPLRLENRMRLHNAYQRVVTRHHELCSYFHFLGKYSMDCRRSESPGMSQLRNALRRKCREIRPVGGESHVPSSCYILLSGLPEMEESSNRTPALKLSDLERHIKESTSSRARSMLSLLPTGADDLKPLLECLEERKAIFTIKHLSPRDPCIIYDDYKLISQIDSALMEHFERISVTNDYNPVVMEVERLRAMLSSLSLNEGVLLNILHRFQIVEGMFGGEYFLPSILKETQLNTKHFNTWQPDPNYPSGFAWCIVPNPEQIVPFFMPHFLYYMLYELYDTIASEGDMSTVTMSHLGVYCKMESKLEVCVIIDSSMVNLNMRCKEEEEVTCLQYRNKFLSAIHQQRKKIQPALKITEYVVSMKAMVGLLPIRKHKRIKEYGKSVDEIRSDAIANNNTACVENELCLEPYIWCRNLSQAHLMNLLDPTLATTPVSYEFIQDLKDQMKDKYDAVCGRLGIFVSDANTSAEELDEEDHNQGVPQYNQLIEQFSEISIFHSSSEFLSALKNQSRHDYMPLHNQPMHGMDEDEKEEAEATPTNAEESSSSSPPSSSVSPKHSHGHSPLLHSLDAGHSSDIGACSSTAGTTETISLQSVQSSLPTLTAHHDVTPQPTAKPNFKFIGDIEQIKCNGKGGEYEHSIHRISFCIPPGAVKEGSTATLTFGVATVGPFKYPDNTTPVSPVLWVQVGFSDGQGGFTKAIKIRLPHAVTGGDGVKHLTFVCCSKLLDTVVFERAHKKSVIGPNEGVLQTKLSKKNYCFCISSKTFYELIANMQYCVVKVTPMKLNPSNMWRIYFFITYALPTCIAMVKNKFDEDYDVNVKSFQFDTFRRNDPSIAIEFQRLLPQRWAVYKEATYQQIVPLDVDFGRVKLHSAVDQMYPPNFTILVNGQKAVQDSLVVFELKGTLPSGLVYEEPLCLSALRRSVSSCFDPHETPTFENQKSETGSIAGSTVSQTNLSRATTTGHGVSSPEKDSADRLKLETRSDTVAHSPLMRRRNMSKEQVNKNIKEILTNRFRMIIQQMDQSEMRQHLYQQQLLTDAEYETLLSSATPAGANERLFFMIKKKGTAVFYNFLNILKNTADECPAHVDLYDTLESDLKVAHILTLYKDVTL